MSASEINNSEQLNVTANLSYRCEVQLQYLVDEINLQLGSAVLPIHLALCMISCAVSALNLVVLTRPKMFSCPLTLLLASLEASNLFMAATYIPPIIVLLFFPSCLIHSTCGMAQMIMVEQSWSAYHFSTWMTTFIGISRLTAVCDPLKSRITLTRTKGVCLILGIVVALTAGDINSYIIVVNKFTSKSYFCDPGDFIFMMSGYVYKFEKTFLLRQIVFIWVFFEALPSVISLVITFCLTWHLACYIRKRKRIFNNSSWNGNCRMTAVLTLLLFGFVVSNFIHMSPYVLQYMEVNQLDSVFKYVLMMAFPSLLFNAFSIVLYYNMSTMFRKSFRESFSRSNLMTLCTVD